jgi:preprotein translocase subunit SecA
VPLLKGLDSGINRLIGLHRRRRQILGKLRAQAEEIEALAKHFKDLSDHQLQQDLLERRTLFRRGDREKDHRLIATLAAIREASDRKLGLRPFPVQLMGALALNQGYLAEMATGEGKTLTAGLTAVPWGWSQQPCHVITVNDYLVQRDAEWLGPLYRFCGIRVGYVTGPMPPEDRQRAYGCDVTYVTSKEVVADFLRDCLRVKSMWNPTRRLIRHLLKPDTQLTGLVMRGLHSAIVDEADSVLIDEAVTPLIIASARPNDALREAVQIAQKVVAPLSSETDYQVNRRYQEVELTKVGLEKLEGLCIQLPGIWRGPERRIELVKQALVARELFHRGQQYLVEDGRLVLVDESTGRRMPQRTWRQGMHQAIEAKETLTVSDPTETLARLSFQRYFRLYYRLAGMTGTAREAATELWQIYGLPVVSIAPNRPCIRRQYPDRFFATEEQKWTAVVEEMTRLHATGRPVLVGSRSVTASENLAQRLASKGFSFQVLNAIHHQQEATVVAMAGEMDRITIATNMAGRGTDIRLGSEVPAMGGLHVVATERHESLRVDRQLFGRSARQGDPGSAQAFMSMDDGLFCRFLNRNLRQWLKSHLERRTPGAQFLAQIALKIAQRSAQKQAFKMRRNVLKTDEWLDEALSFAGSETS